MQAQVGSAAYLLPATLSGLVGVLTTLPVGVTEQIDGLRTASLVADEHGVAIAFHLRDARKAALAVSDACVQSRTAAEPNAPGAPSNSADARLGVTNVYTCPGHAYAVTERGVLVWSESTEAVRALAPYVDTLEPKAESTHALAFFLHRRAFVTVLPSRLRARWTELSMWLLEQAQAYEQSKGRPADLADPGAIIRAASQLVEAGAVALAQVQMAQGTVDVKPEGITVITNVEGYPILGEALRAPSTRGCSEGSDDSLFSLCIARTGPDQRRATRWTQAAKEMLGARLSTRDEEELASTIRIIDEGVGTAAQIDVDLVRGGTEGASAIGKSPARAAHLMLSVEAGKSTEVMGRRIAEHAKLLPLQLGKRSEGPAWIALERKGRTPLEIAWTPSTLVVGSGVRDLSIAARPSASAAYSMAQWALFLRPSVIGFGKSGPPMRLFAEKNALSVLVPPNVVREVVHQAF
jgi:hypothetical protein